MTYLDLTTTGVVLAALSAVVAVVEAAVAAAFFGDIANKC
jgi:hypothetical protein